jgi:hypothetical protein
MTHGSPQLAARSDSGAFWIGKNDSSAPSESHSRLKLPQTPIDSRTFRLVAGSVHCAMNMRVPRAVTRTPSPGATASNTSRSLRPASTRRVERKRSVSFGLFAQRTFLSGFLRTPRAPGGNAPDGVEWRPLTRVNQQAVDKSKQKEVLGRRQAAYGGARRLISLIDRFVGRSRSRLACQAEIPTG